MKSALPAKFSPQLATLVEEPPKDPAAWVYEVKFDGYRLLVRVERSAVQLVTRNGHDWSARFPALLKELKRLELPPGWYDGEVVALNEKGVPDFGALQASFETTQARAAVMYLFDLPYCSGRDLRALPLDARRRQLREILSSRQSASVRFSEEFAQDPREILASACRLGLEGVIAKRRESAYVSRRSPDWIKLKCGHRQEFVVGGYTDPQGSRTVLGSLLLGVYGEDGTLRYAGNVGAGFDAPALKELKAPLKRLASSRRPFAGAAAIPRRPHWIKPQLVVEVSFSEWTRDGRLRHPVFHGVRADKDPRSIIREPRRQPWRRLRPGRSRPQRTSHRLRLHQPGRA